jgi:orotidine-5'-phosphate decarboxylase
MNRFELIENIKAKRSFLSVGLDTEMEKLPGHLPRNCQGVVEFNTAIINATAHYCVAYKINTAFYEQYGAEGWLAMKLTLEAIPPGFLIIADAKRGDIGNTSTLYARAFFGQMNFDAITVSPYMGRDSVEPFLQFKDKFVIVLGLTSNSGSKDFQNLITGEKKLYEVVISAASKWGTLDNMMFVAGATKASMFADIRKIIPDHFLLVPGIGAQGGNLDAVVKYGMNDNVGLLVNSSRGIIYSSSGYGYAKAAAAAASDLQKQMAAYL